MEDRQSLAYLESFVNTTVKKQINDKIRSSHLVSRKAVTVHEYNGVNNTASIIFPTDPDTPSIYYYPNRSGVALQKGQKVYLNYQVDNISQGWLELNEPLFNINQMYDLIFPVGSIIGNESKDFDPNEVYQGTTWVRYAPHRALFGYDATNSDFNEGGKEGGSRNHYHGNGAAQNGSLSAAIGATNGNAGVLGYKTANYYGFGDGLATYTVNGTGFSNGGAFNHYTQVWGDTAWSSYIPEYKVVCWWKRTK